VFNLGKKEINLVDFGMEIFENLSFVEIKSSKID
jgi:hypothetical protein